MIDPNDPNGSVDAQDLPDPLEERLRALRPAEPPPEFLIQLHAADPSRIRYLPWLWATPLAVAAAWLVLLQVHQEERTAPSMSRPQAIAQAKATPLSEPSDFRVFVPVSERSQLVGVSDLGVVQASPTQPIRLFRTTWIDDTTFRGDDGQSALLRARPRETIVPVALEVF